MKAPGAAGVLREAGAPTRVAIVNNWLTRLPVSQFELFIYCAAVGFACSATIASFYQWVTSERPDFSVSKATATGVVVVILLSMFGGPFIVMQKVVSGLRSQELRALPALAGVAVAGMWSVCAGIFYVGLLITT
jgi:hypothetical protein